MKFERGKDPKEALKVGIKSTLPQLKEMYAELKGDLKQFRHMHLPDYEAAINELILARPQRLVAKCGWTNIDEIFDDLTVEEYGPIYLLVKKHHEIIVQNKRNEI